MPAVWKFLVFRDGAEQCENSAIEHRVSNLDGIKVKYIWFRVS